MAETRTPSTASLSWIEHEALEHIKGALRVMLAWEGGRVAVEQRRSSLAFSLQSFSRHLQRLMRIEEQDGYMAEVEEINPRLSSRIRVLADEHDRFRQHLADLAPRLDAVDEWNAIELEDVCGEIKEFLREVDDHDLAEIRLLQEALTLDEGGEG